MMVFMTNFPSPSLIVRINFYLKYLHQNWNAYQNKYNLLPPEKLILKKVGEYLILIIVLVLVFYLFTYYNLTTNLINRRYISSYHF